MERRWCRWDSDGGARDHGEGDCDNGGGVR